MQAAIEGHDNDLVNWKVQISQLKGYKMSIFLILVWPLSSFQNYTFREILFSIRLPRLSKYKLSLCASRKLICNANLRFLSSSSSLISFSSISLLDVVADGCSVTGHALRISSASQGGKLPKTINIE